MRSIRLTLCTGLMLGTALTPAAYAADGGGIAVTPSSPAPGTDIALRVSGCTAATATAVSAAFVAEARLTGADGTLIGETRIRTSLRAGSYDVKVTCGGTDRTAALTVVEKSSQSGRPTPEPTAPASPVAPVHAGGGGTAHLAAVNTAEETRPAGPGTGHAVIGLILAAAAAVAVVLRSTRRSRGTG
ncbi:membrane protein [Streptomyces sp. MMG1533]|uniref:hypothetical protein n=1 Tax=Streptomyces sp. MMG1533 TaxID=1415546 RepID=UPI0006B057A9|nr:hypothetical protein [Streptomyces sp. MMG1533]KOU66436.1 membrane protein [Streptomyces sp. MMG1533]